MARKLAQRLDRLERDFAALLTEDTSPIYLREGEPVPDGIDPRRGKLEPSLASRLSQILFNQRCILETVDAERRIEQLEALLQASNSGKLIQITANGKQSVLRERTAARPPFHS